ncbi:hypothetical protein OSTOST_08595 [Ostertagia ostertagi]
MNAWPSANYMILMLRLFSVLSAGAFEGWIRRIAVNTIADYFRRQPPQTASLAEDTNDTAAYAEVDGLRSGQNLTSDQKTGAAISEDAENETDKQEPADAVSQSANRRTSSAASKNSRRNQPAKQAVQPARRSKKPAMVANTKQDAPDKPVPADNEARNNKPPVENKATAESAGNSPSKEADKTTATTGRKANPRTAGRNGRNNKARATTADKQQKVSGNTDPDHVVGVTSPAEGGKKRTDEVAVKESKTAGNENAGSAASDASAQAGRKANPGTASRNNRNNKGTVTTANKQQKVSGKADPDNVVGATSPAQAGKKRNNPVAAKESNPVRQSDEVKQESLGMVKGERDVSCGLFKITSANCNSAATTPLVAPPGFQDYTWYNASYTAVLGTGQTIHIPTPATTTDYHVILTPYPGYGCTDTLTTQVLFSALTVNATPDSANLCHASQVQLNATQTGSASPYTYSWAPAAGLNCIFCPNPMASPTVNTAYTVSVTDAIGCTVTDTVAVVAPLSLTETHTDVSCNGGNNGSITVGVIGGVPPYSYSWNTSPQQTASSIQNLGPGVYTVTVRDVTNCMATKTIIISQPSPMTVTVSSTDIRCAGVGAGMAWVRAAGGVAPYNYSWNTVPPQSNDTAFGLPAGTYTCTVIDANRCVKTISSTINESNPFTVSTQLIKRSCPGELNSEVRALVLGGVGTIRYSWNTNPVRSTPVLDRIGQGTYIITVQDSVGCIARDTIAVTDFPGPVVTAGNEVEICEGESTTLNAGGALTYQWYASSPTLSCINCPSTIVTPDTTTVYYVIGTDVNGCKDTGLVTVHVLQRMPVTVDSTRRICLGEEVMLGATGGIYYEWTPVDNMDGPFLPNPVTRPTKTTTYQVIITENRCFKDTLQQTVVVMPLPTINIMNGFSGIPGAMVPLTTTVANAQTITWWPPTGLSCTDCFQPVATLDKSIIYIAEVSDSIGCKARDTIRIIVGCDGNAFYLANTFTPNNDGQNDYFYPQGLGVNKVNRFMVYNRWGEVVFAASDLPVNVPERGWDGLFHGKELPPDVFVYVVEAICPDGSPVVLKGDVTLVR